VNLPAFSVRNALAVNLITVLALIAGFFSLLTIRKEAFPPVSFDTVTVRTFYPGASPSVVEKFVTIKLEDELKSVDGIDEMLSVSGQNISIITLQLDPNEGKKRQKIVNDIQRAVDRVKDLPEGVLDNPIVKEFDAQKFPVVVVSVSGLEYPQLQRYAKVLEDRLLNISSVGSVSRVGYHEPEIWVEIDPDKAHLYYVSLSAVMDSLKKRNINLTGGTLETSEGEINIRTDGEFENAEDVERVVIRSNDQGRFIRIGDVARVMRSFEDDDTFYATDGKESINLIVVKKISGDVIEMVEEIKRVSADLVKAGPEGLAVDYLDDMSYFVKRRLGVLRNNGIWGSVQIMVLLFLVLAPQIAVTAALDILMTFLMTVAVMRALGMTINLMTMFGMIMVIGMLVDDAIIMAENIFRHIEKGGDVREAAVRGANEVMKPITAAVLTSISAYLPLALMSGIIGRFVRAIPIVVSLALSISWLTTVFLIPSHAAEFTLWMKHRARNRDKHWFAAVQRFYMKFVKKAIDFRYLVFLGIFLFSAFTIFVIAPRVKFVLFPSEGVDEFYVRAETKIGTPLEETYRRIKPIEAKLDEIPSDELENYISEVGVIQEGFGDPREQRGSHFAQIHVFLTPSVDRERKAQEIINELKEKVEGTPGLEELKIERVHGGPPVGKAVEAKIRGDDYETIRKVADRYKEFLETIPGVSSIDDTYEEGKDEIGIIVDAEKTARAGLTLKEVATEIRNAFEGGIATTIQKSDEEIDIRVRFPERHRNSVKSLEKIYIPNAVGNLIPLKEIVTFERKPSLSTIQRFDRKRMVAVTAEVDDELITSVEVNSKLMKQFADIQKEFPSISVIYGGEQERTMESMMSLFFAFAAAILLIFCIIAIQFRSLIQPPLVMTAIPLGFLGVTWALFLHGKTWGFLPIMGFIGLSGVVVNDSIVMIDFMNRLRREGIERRESIIRSCDSRFRAIIMASITTVAGTLPIAYGWGGDDPFVRAMALAFTWGIAFASSITLFAIPCFYAILDDISVKIFHHSTVKVNGR